MNDRFTRVKWLVGNENFEKIAKTRVLIFGLGGVGGICTDALFRTGFTKLTLIDADSFENTNLNRQLHSEHIGEKRLRFLKKFTMLRV